MTHRFRVLRLLVALLLLGSVAPLVAVPVSAAPRTWRLVAIGDSIPFGGQYCGDCTPYPLLLAVALRAHSGHPVAVTNLGIPGLTTAQLLANVRSRADVRRALAAADIVTITIGHNDTPWNSRHDTCDGAHAFFGAYRDAVWSSYAGACLTKEAGALRSRLAAVLATVRTLRGAKPTLIEVTTDWNQLLGRSDVPAAGRSASKAVLDRFAAVICSAAREAGARCADVYHAFNGTSGMNSARSLLAADHDHASQLGHQRIAAVLAAFGFAPLPK